MEGNISAPKLIARNALERSTQLNKFLFPCAPRIDLFRRLIWSIIDCDESAINFYVCQTQCECKWAKGSGSRNELSVPLFKVNRSKRKRFDEKSLKNSMKASTIIEHKSTATSKILASESDKTCSTTKTVCLISHSNRFSTIVNSRRPVELAFIYLINFITQKAINCTNVIHSFITFDFFTTKLYVRRVYAQSGSASFVSSLFLLSQEQT